MVKEKPATSVSNAMKRRLHMEGKRIKPSILDFASASVIFVDVRPVDLYIRSHIRHAFSIPASVWANASTEDFCFHLKKLYFPDIIKHVCNQSHHDQLGKIAKMKESLGIQHDTHLVVLYNSSSKDGCVTQLNQMIALFRNTFRDYPGELIPHEHTGTKVELFQLRKGFEELNLKKYQVHLYEAEKEEQAGWKRSTVNIQRHKSHKHDIHEIIPGVLYYGDVLPYYKFAKKQGEKSQQQLFEEYRSNKRDAAWNVVEEIFDLRGHSRVPSYIHQTADSTQSYGVRVITEVVTKETTLKTKTKGFFKKKVKHKAETVTEQSHEYVEDENVTRTFFRFPNGFSFTLNRAEIEDFSEESSLFSILHCLEGSTIKQKAILVQHSAHSIAVVLGYLVHVRKWSLRRSFKFVYKRLPRSLITQYSETMIEPVRHYLEYEQDTLPHVFPSIPFRIIILFHLNMEPNLDANLRKCKNTEIWGIERQLFENIEQGNVDYVINLLRITQEFDLSRTSLKAGDETPLITALRVDNPAVRSDTTCFELLTRIECIQLSTINGRDAMYHAIEAGECFVSELIRKGALVTTSSLRLKMNPLQRALKYQLSLETLTKLATEDTVNHRDLYQRTPCHYAIEANYSDHKLQEIIAMLLKQGANLFLTDVEGNTPLQYATMKSKSSSVTKYLTKMANTEGTVRYEPFQSYAPPRENISVNYYIDGENYFSALAKALRKARKSVYISGWWLTPEIFLERSGDNYSEWIASRLDNILKEIADRGVEVRILLWENFAQAEDIKNDLAIKKLEDMSENIKGMCHTSSFIDGYTHHQKIVVIDEYDAFVGGLDLCLHRWDQQSHPVYPSFLYVGKDYFNSRFLGDPTHSDNSVALPKRDYHGLADRNIPRSGWHDIHLRVDALAAADVSRNFVQRWNFVRKQHSKYEPLQLPSFEGVFSTDPPAGAFNTTAQLTRSISKWSVGFDLKESSIINAIKHAITTAKTFVYIETQFFISVQGSSSIINEETRETESLADVIINRIRKAVRTEQPFKIIIVLPMFPEGNPLDYVTQRIMYWQLKTIEFIQNEVNLMTRGTPLDSSDYIRFYSLGNYGFIDQKVVAEQIYIHAKLLLTDDYVICGSANLNMRSLAGDRDSEIAVVVTCPEMSLQMRKELWREHLGENVEITDVFLDDVPKWEKVARENSKLYCKLFEHSCPLGGPRTKEQFLTAEKIFTGIWATVNSKKTFEMMAQQIHGHLVKFPQHFLEDDILNTEKIRAHPLSMFSPGMITQLKEATVVNIKEDIVQ